MSLAAASRRDVTLGSAPGARSGLDASAFASAAARRMICFTDGGRSKFGWESGGAGVRCKIPRSLKLI
jgi:hypothetical protein